MATLVPVNLSIKNVPDDLAARLRTRARRNHRSLQGELRAMLDEHLAGPAVLSSAEVLRLVETMGLRTPSESVRMIRADREARARR